MDLVLEGIDVQGIYKRGIVPILAQTHADCRRFLWLQALSATSA